MGNLLNNHKHMFQNSSILMMISLVILCKFLVMRRDPKTTYTKCLQYQSTY